MASSGPLKGLRVVELATFIAGPFASRLLADLGADVIKVEQPGAGDPFRTFSGGGYSPHFVAYNVNKRSITLDTHSEIGKLVMRRLLERADVFVENFRPGVMARMGLDYECVKDWNRRLIYCSITGFGQSGPYRDRPSYDGVGQGMSGLTGQLVTADRPRIVGPAFSDCMTGMTGAYAILAAVYARQQTGQGQYIDLSMVAATAGFLASEVSNYFQTGEPGDPRVRARASQSFALPCADGKLITVHVSGSEKFTIGLLEAVNRLDLLEDERFKTRPDRVKNFDAFEELLQAEFRKRSRAEWEPILQEHDVPFAPVYSFEDMFADPHVQHLGLKLDTTHPEKGALSTIAPAPKFSATPADGHQPPPTIGQHTAEILQELGLQDLPRV
ncbi:MAG TPA: CaiB/BaiF CoA-transferase family protein [Chloroflexota bacterium]|nr:CaiB/BaiF CoA-transferase family protein [Chloroflexota bacterium]